jgi:hypothetical protein
VSPRLALSITAALAIGLTSVAADAKPGAPAVFCATYPDAPACASGAVACSYCHTKSEAPAEWNLYGSALKAALLPSAPRPLDDATFAMGLPDALAAIAQDDSDGDMTSNQGEILGGSLPGDASSHPTEATCPDDAAKYDYAVCHYDSRYVLRKLSLDFCGQSPTLEAIEALEKAAGADREKMLDDALDACMQSEFWRGKDGAVWRLAHRKIRPLSSIKSGENPGVIPLADYDDDYALFVYTQIDDHDAREALSANFFVTRTPASDGSPTTYTRVDGKKKGQAVDLQHREGMLTTAWFLVSNVMFTALPRTAAAQAYRSYLGFEIARQEGLHPISSEPKDYDEKGVGAPVCASCHSTLDPMTYPFRNYNGLGNGGQGRYIPNRIEKFFADQAPDITKIPESGAILGKPVNDLAGWVQVAIASDEFATATVHDYWVLTFGADPTPKQSADYGALWKSFESDDNYSVARMLHRLIHTEAYGEP